MGHNIEIKARLHDRARVEQVLRELGARDAGPETQRDTFWQSGRCRLKLRESSRAGETTLIAYRRAAGAELRSSHYERSPVADPDGMRRVLDAALERAGEVRKIRHLHWIDNVRVHLDEVDGLGTFIELEAVVDAAHSEAACKSLATALLDRFGIAPEDRLAAAYVDLDAHGTAGPR